MAEIKVRFARQEDIPAIVELWNEMVDYHVDLDPHLQLADYADEVFSKHLADQLDNDNVCLATAFDETRTAGYCMAEIKKNPPVLAQQEYGFISDLAITEDYCRQGIGEELFEYTKEWFDEKGMERIELRVMPSHPLSTRFWKKMGFQTFMEIMAMDL